MKSMMFARTFPMTHPRKGEPTYFVEKIWSGLADEGLLMDHQDFTGLPLDFQQYYNAVPKWHTIRAGNRWKVGDFFTPRVWSGRPYNSKTIIFGPPIEVKKVWPFVIRDKALILDTCDFGTFCGQNTEVQAIAKNDGLAVQDFLFWFQPKKKWVDFEGQIICWNQSIEY